jgi:hypothetical protein
MSSLNNEASFPNQEILWLFIKPENSLYYLQDLATD